MNPYQAEETDEDHTKQDLTTAENENAAEEDVEQIANDPLPCGVVVTLILIIYTGLMMITGIMVYSA